MRIWIDFCNTPQVSFWIPFIKEFEKEKHDLLLTCRNSANTVALLQLNGLQFHVIGEGAGEGNMQKTLLFLKRLWKLYFYIRKNRPDIAASQSSFYQPVVSRFLGIPCLYTNDNEHANGNLFGFWFAKKIILPVALQNEAFTQKYPLKRKVSFYPSVKEAVYLSQQNGWFPAESPDRDTIYFRPEPWTAQYYTGPKNFFDDTLIRLSLNYKVVILPRDKNQADHFKQQKFINLKVAEKPLNLKEIAGNCKLFIGAGGSMTRELAVLGIPVVSVYQDKLLKVDNYLIEKGCMTINPKITYEEIITLLMNTKTKQQKSTVLSEGTASYITIKNLVNNLKFG